MNAVDDATVDPDGGVRGVALGRAPVATAVAFVNGDGIGVNVVPFEPGQFAYPQAGMSRQNRNGITGVRNTLLRYGD